MAVGPQNKMTARWLMPVIALLAVFQLVACGDKEPEQRKQFIDYLQNTVMRSGQNLPSLSEDQKQKLGNYANDYNVLLTFSRQMKQAVDNSLAPVVNTIAEIRVPQDYLLKRDSLQQSLGALNMLSQQVQGIKSQADTAHATMKQPDDLKAVYEQAYSAIVTRPATAIAPIVPGVVSLAQDLIKIGAFLHQQGTQVAFENGQVQFQTSQQVAQYNAMMSSLIAKQSALQSAQKALTGQF